MLFQNIPGHYMYMDPYQHPVYGSSSSSYHGPTRYARMTSPEFPPSTEYCVRFMYTMYGTDVKTLNIYAKVSNETLSSNILNIECNHTLKSEVHKLMPFCRESYGTLRQHHKDPFAI